MVNAVKNYYIARDTKRTKADAVCDVAPPHTLLTSSRRMMRLMRFSEVAG
jgi:hypothetical protein